MASYSGDVNNFPAADTCGLALETVRVAPFVPTLSPWLLAVLVGLLGLIGAVAGRRRGATR